MRIALNYQRVDPSKGGAETYIVDLSSALIARGHDVTLYANSWAGAALPAELKTRRVDVSGLTKWQKLWSFARNSEQALQIDQHALDCTVGFINTWHQDVLIPQGGVHAASLHANSLRFPAGVRRLAYLAGKSINPKRLIYRAIEQKQYAPERGTRIVAVSKMVRGHLQKYQGVSAERVDVIPNAIDTSRLAVENSTQVRADFRAKLGLHENDLVGLFVGHNYALKGLAPLLEGLARRGHENRPIHLVVCGGTDTAPYQAMAERLGISNNVHLIVFQPDIRPPFWASDFFVSPTFYDPCSLVVFEALACGLPVITTTCNGAGEVMTEGVEGFVVEHPTKIDQIARALDQMTDDAARTRMSVAAAALGREQSFDRHVTSLLAVFERVAAAKRTQSKETTAPHFRPSFPEAGRVARGSSERS